MKRKTLKQPKTLTEAISIVAGEQVLTSHDVGKMLQVNPTSVNKWAADGHLKCYRTPGKHRRFLLSEVKLFAAKFKMPLMDIR